MGQIVRRRKKGRPSKADLARRSSGESAAAEREPRRSLRRRNVRYTFDFDDYIDDDEFFEDDDDDVKRREKKLKLLLKLQQGSGNKEGGGGGDSESTRRVLHTPTDSPSSSEYDDDDSKPSKKRKIGGDDDDDDEIDGDECEDNEIEDFEEEVGGRKAEARGGVDSVPGTPSDSPAGIPLPDKKTLEMILDKLQKKDIYGVYAEPVDPEELPDYHDVIKQPMDFATVRNKLGNGKYSTLEQLESDVLLICTNAMQYNAPDTIYYKQASSIQELAKRKFQRLRDNIEPSEIEIKSEQKTTSGLLPPKTYSKKPVGRTMQEPVGSDFSSGATLATAGEFQNGCSVVQAATSERPNSVDGLTAENSSLVDINPEKGEESLPGKSLFSKLGRKPSLQDENRRATFNISNQPVAASESIFSTFESESKQLVPVGLHADHSYARSLARFAATLGSVAWKVASKRIVQALPAGTKFGRGWVGEYEPLPTPVLMLENCNPKEPVSLTRFQSTADVREDEKPFINPVRSKKLHGNVPTSKEKSQSQFYVSSTTSPSLQLPAIKEFSPRGASLGVRPPFLSFPGAKPTGFVNSNHQQQNSPSRSSVEPEKRSSAQVELNHLPSASNNTTDFVAHRPNSNGSGLPASRSEETVLRNRNLLPSASFKQLNNNGFVAEGRSSGKAMHSNLDSNRMVTSSSGNNPNNMIQAGNYFPHRQEQGLSDPVQMMKILAEKSQQQQKTSNNSSVDTHPVVQQVLSPRREESNNAASAAARAWMSLGAGGVKSPTENTSSPKHQISADSLYNPAHDRQQQVSRFRGEVPVPGMLFQPDKNGYPVHAFVTQPIRMTNEAEFQNRPMGFPQFATADLSRFQMQSPWRGVNPQMQPRAKQESFPPDLNIDFQSMESPARQSSGVLVDSQQPDLALQL